MITDATETEWREIVLHDNIFDQAWQRLEIVAHDIAREKGFWENPPVQGVSIALMHSELSEALEAIRKPDLTGHLQISSLLEEELADVIIRIMDFAAFHNLNVAGAIREKLAFNATREKMHGGKRF